MFLLNYFWIGLGFLAFDFVFVCLVLWMWCDPDRHNSNPIDWLDPLSHHFPFKFINPEAKFTQSMAIGQWRMPKRRPKSGPWNSCAVGFFPILEACSHNHLPANICASCTIHMRWTKAFAMYTCIQKHICITKHTKYGSPLMSSLILGFWLHPGWRIVPNEALALDRGHDGHPSLRFEYVPEAERHKPIYFGSWEEVVFFVPDRLQWTC